MKTKKINDASALAVTGKCRFYGYLVGVDGTNDPTVSIYDSITAAGTEVAPTTTYDSSALGLNGFMIGNSYVECDNGIYVEITLGAGAVEIIVYYEGGLAA